MERIIILRRNRPRVSNFLSHRMVGSLKFMIVVIIEKSLHHQMILGHPDALLFFRGKPEKLDFRQQNTKFATYSDSVRFGVTGGSGNIFCVEIDPESPIFCLTE